MEVLMKVLVNAASNIYSIVVLGVMVLGSTMCTNVSRTLGKNLWTIAKVSIFRC